MTIISISLNDDNLKALDGIQAMYGLAGRSEAVRRAIGAAQAEAQDTMDMDGAVEGVLIIVKKDHADPWMSLIQAKHEDDIKTQLHSHLKNHKCLEVMVISSDAKDLAAMLKDIHAKGKADYVRFVRS
ncbi:MAG: CopG family ribbon-helix-helix protein [Candidatus Methanoplasma sp.]|jgi:CopG family nickel-responsive transcriptional regulator|nr:CopG family ribbon-helix-helix protein [Candidatus Methanoplasma sp.]